MTAIELFNLALFKLGVSKTIETVDDAAVEAYVGSRVYDHILRATLRHFPWPFATKYRGCTDDAPYKLYLVSGPFWTTDPAELTLVQAWSASQTYVLGDVARSAGVNYYALQEHTNQQPPNASYWSTSEDDRPETSAGGDWLYAYRWPTDCLFVRRVVPPASVGTGRVFTDNPPKFRIGRDVNGLLIYSNTPEMVIEYTTIDCGSLWADDLWIDAFTWRLAGYLAPTQSKMTDAATKCDAMYELTIARAAAVTAKEMQDERHGESEWIRGRG